MRVSARMGRALTGKGALALAGICVFAVLASVASASGTYDLRGTWAVGGTGGAASGDLTITSMNLSTGAFSGTSFGGRFKVKGTETGTHLAMTQTGGGYVATDTGVVSSAGKRMSGAWHDSNGVSGTWFGTRTGAPKPKHSHHKHKHKHKHKHHKSKHKHHKKGH